MGALQGVVMTTTTTGMTVELQGWLLKSGRGCGRDVLMYPGTRQCLPGCAAGNCPCPSTTQTKNHAQPPSVLPVVYGLGDSSFSLLNCWFISLFQLGFGMPITTQPWFLDATGHRRHRRLVVVVMVMAGGIPECWVLVGQLCASAWSGTPRSLFRPVNQGQKLGRGNSFWFLGGFFFFT